MEVRPGYKHTEVGVIPEEWDVRPVTEVTRAIFLGLTSKVDYVASGGIPLVRASDIAGGRLNLIEAREISLQQHRELTKYRRAMRGNVLVSKSGSLGVCAIVDVDTEFSIYESIIVLQPTELLDASFLLSLLRDHATQTRMIGEKVGSTVAHLNLEIFRKLVVAVPSVVEQRAIAAALSDVDALLGGLDRLIAKKRDLKQTAMEQLLTGQTRLPRFSGEWDLSSLDGVVTRATGVWGLSRPDDRCTRAVEIIRAGDISQEGQLIATATRFVSDDDFSRAVCSLDDLVITTSGNVGKVWWCDGRANVAASNFVRILRPAKAKASGKFLSYALRTSAGRRQLHEHTATSVYPNLRPTYFSTPWIPLPSVVEQTAIAAVLSDMDTEIEALEARRAKTGDLKQGMMQELLTGRTRLV